MSKERELLKRCLDFMIDVGANLNPLFKEVNDELLAQPEYIVDVTDKVEPVAWMNEAGGCFLSDGIKYSNLWTPLYTAPPKRERINHDDILDRSIDGSFEYRDGFMDGVMFAENHHGIGEDDE